jgi:hypothetical protein
MARHLSFAITLVGTGALLNSPAEAVTAARCQDQSANCIGRCDNPGGGVNNNKCMRPAGDQLYDTRVRRGSARLAAVTARGAAEDASARRTGIGSQPPETRTGAATARRRGPIRTQSPIPISSRPAPVTTGASFRNST